MLSTLSHERIVKLVSFDNLNYEWVKTEYCGLDLLKFMENHKKPFTEPTIRFLFHQIVEVVQWLHERKVYHRDLKLENILIKDTQLTLCDFGSSFALRTAGTEGYMAPELYSNSEVDLALADVFSLGVVLFVMVFGFQPFSNT